MRSVKAARLSEMTRQVAEEQPDAEVYPNAVGNLAIMRDRRYIGWLDLDDGTIHWVDDEADGAA